jgi:hypothetical protein
VALLGGLFIGLKPIEAPSPAASTSESAAASKNSESAAPALPIFELHVRDGRLVSGPQVIRLRQGDEILLRITSDTSDEFHLHGYNRELQLKAGEPATLQIHADLAGRFGYELHHMPTELGALEVLPR